MIKCLRCGKEHDYDGQKYCVGCGASLQSQKDSKVLTLPENPVSENPAASENKTRHTGTAYDNLPPAFRGEPGGETGFNSSQPDNGGYGMPPQYASQPQYIPPQYYPPNRDNFCEPLGVFGFIVTMLVTSIPVVGLIAAIIWAIGGSGTNINRRNYCRAWLIISIASTVLSVLAVLICFGITVPLIRDVLNRIAYEAQYSAGNFYY